LTPKDRKDIKELTTRTEIALKNNDLRELERLLLKAENLRTKINTIFLSEFKNLNIKE
jgi:hypothetical protein